MSNMIMKDTRSVFMNGILDTVKTLNKHKYIYLMLLPLILYYLIFQYIPMGGLIIAFKNYSPSKGLFSGDWVGFKYFLQFFNSIYAWRLVRNTLMINIYDLIFSFPAPIILALLLNEVRKNKFKRTIQTVTYLPHFISLVVVIGIVKDFFSADGIVNEIIKFLNLDTVTFLTESKWFYPIFVGSGIWQDVGWGSIIYLAALSAVNMELYDASYVDGANRWQQLIHVTLPGISPTIIIMLILRIGSMMNVGFEKVILLYNPSIYEVSDVISTYVYRKGLLELNFSYSTAIGLFNSVINFMLLLMANTISKKYSESSLW